MTKQTTQYSLQKPNRWNGRRYFSGLRTRLTLTYMLVTVGALLALLIVLLSGLFTLIATSGVGDIGYLEDVEVVLGSRALDYLETADLAGLQAWMDRRYASGAASNPPLNIFDSPLAPFAAASDFYFIDQNGIVLAQSPQRDAVGKPLPLPAPLANDWLAERLTEPSDPVASRHVLPDGNWFYVFAVRAGETEYGAFALTVSPSPPFVRSYLPVFGTIVAGATFVLLIGVAPFGALFGYLMARNLTKRLARLETAAEAYSRGDFHRVPEEQSGDEIGRLANRLQQMAQQIATLLQSRQELTLLEERNRLARELHDTVKQQNFATLMQLRAAKNLAEQGRAADVALRHLDSAENLLKQSQQDLKNVIEELRPTQLESQGLAAALQTLADEWAAHNDIAATVTVEGEQRLGLTAEQALYRVAQEALSNIARHSQATSATLMLRHTPESTTLAISDNGRGFPHDLPTDGFGLTTMRQRITQLNGDLSIEQDNGVTVTATLFS